MGDNGKNRGQRLAMLLGFGFLTGLGMGPMLQLAMMMNPSIVPSAFMITSIVFACFTGAALTAPDGKYLYLGWTLHSLLAGTPQRLLQVHHALPGSPLDWNGG